MALPQPNLDDRRFQDIVDEAKRLIPRYSREWTDHNVSDPGVTLIELFAWMTEMLIFRLNRVPEKNFVNFMELMGVRLEPPAAARTLLTFRLAAPTESRVTIPAGTEVATVQTSTETAVTFTTDVDLQIPSPQLRALLVSPDDRSFTDQTLRLGIEPFAVFEATPKPGNAFYVGLAEDASNTILGLHIDCSVEAIGIDPLNPPRSWEAWCHDGWHDVDELERDETQGFNQSGLVLLHLPLRMAERTINGTRGFWVRCRHTPASTDQKGYSKSPRLRALRLSAHGGSVSATHAIAVHDELLGRSDGMPGQSFRLERVPVLPLRNTETLEVQDRDGSWEAWTRVEHFGESRPGSMHYTLDYVSGEVQFGPSIREPDGSERQYGAIPPRGSAIRFKRYRTGGGAIGNVAPGKVNALNSTLPYVDSVNNRKPAVGGRDAESLEHAKLRAPRVLRSSYRAVTAEDYENLACQASGGVARARCIQPRAAAGNTSPPAGVVRVLIVPALSNPRRLLGREELRPPRELLQEVQTYLDDRRLLTSVAVVGPPEYRWVKVLARIKPRPEAEPERVRSEALNRLYGFLNPLLGGAGEGWPFGRDLFVGEIYAQLQQVPGVEYVQRIDLLVEGENGPQEQVGVAADALIASQEHQVFIV